MKLNKKVLSIFLALVMIISVVTVGNLLSADAATGNVGDVIYLEYTGSGVPNVYMWKGSGGEGNHNNSWPGVAMTLVEAGVYSYTLTDAYEKLIFNVGGAQTDNLNYPGNNKIFRAGNNIKSLTASTVPDNYDPSLAEPSISITPKNGTTFRTDSIDISINVQNADSSYYTVDGGSQTQFNTSASFTAGQSTALNATVTVFVSATNANGTVTQTVVYTKKEALTSDGNDGSTSPALDGYYGTNPDGKVGVNKTITIDGSISDWDSSMLIAQATANDDPRVYRQNSMYEVPYDDYALYAAWDNDNLYLMWEMSNVQDIVAPNDNYPLSQGNQWINDIPVHLAFSVDPTKHGDGTNGAGGTVWNSGITFDTHMDTWVSFSSKAVNSYIYKSNDEGVFNFADSGENSGIKLKEIMGIAWGNQTISTELWGIDKAYGTYNDRIPGDILNPESAWVDFYAKGHDKKLDMFYEVSIPLSYLGIDKNYIENQGIGVMKITTCGISGMDSLPYDMSMQDNADLPSTSSQEFNSHEKEDADHITVPLARIGKMLVGGTDPKPTTIPTTPIATTPIVTTTIDNMDTTVPISTPIPTITNPIPTTTINDIETSSDYLSSDPVTTTWPTQTYNYKMGDVGMDGNVTIGDATEMQKALAKMITFNEIQSVLAVTTNGANTERKNQYTISDVTEIQKWLAKLDANGNIGTEMSFTFILPY